MVHVSSFSLSLSTASRLFSLSMSDNSVPSKMSWLLEPDAMQRFLSRLGEALIKRLISSREKLNRYTELVLLAVICGDHFVAGSDPCGTGIKYSHVPKFCQLAIVKLEHDEHD
ncbi:uncharacterized protein P174DRAFT_429322 [Aspergillus novofumigatus IBT 16806]|uniref:Uncharacterized protein n=1 Tax=Aspergillus novofumigatus (strain IBT 16806) TaxID=1392255 RepID=A0A2I1CB83_ASPN1|nr:uncharacterized protein P174DRAFT_429322 [Aspergillus novofumigatus IBT 16806]PKX94883.1 hypothetical protein P174DRAFT_429322 [Aspergillus novofumigatus IBT 16806]